MVGVCDLVEEESDLCGSCLLVAENGHVAQRVDRSLHP